MGDPPRRQGDEPEQHGGERERASAEHAAERVVDEPRGREQGEADHNGPPRGQVGDALVDQIRVGVGVIEDDQEREAAQPSGVRLPLEPVQRLRQHARRDGVLLHLVEAAAVDLPRLAADAGVAVWLAGRRPQMIVERDEVKGRADPDDAGDDVQPAQEQVEPVGRV